MQIKGSTADHEIARMQPHEILQKFVAAKVKANKFDAERDRLRKFIQVHLEPGRYEDYILEKIMGSPRVYSTSEGNVALQTYLVIDAGLTPPKIKPDQKVALIDDSGELLLEGFIVDNNLLFSKKAPINLKITEIPNEEAEY